MRIIVVGAGKVGTSLTAQLIREHRVTVIDQEPKLIENIINVYDVMGVCGNGASYEVQKEAEVGKADLLIATTSSDEINILACLVAKKLGVAHTIARIRNPEYETQLRFMRGELGLTMSINPEKAAAHEIARVLRFPAAMKLESFSKGRLELVEYRLPEGSALDGVRLLDIYRNARARVLICAVSRKGQTTIPSGDFELKTGDKIYVTAAPEHLSAFFQYLGVFRKKASTVMIVGASKMCYYLADELLHMGMSVKIVDQNETRCTQMSEQLPRALVIMGDGTDSELLAEEGIEVAVVSMPCTELFDRQDISYQEEVLGTAPRIAIEAASKFGWERYVGLNGDIIGMDGFGASGPAAELYNYFGITKEEIIDSVKNLLKE
mgnify:CR=1 FL=1